jgi:hypothetical protein
MGVDRRQPQVVWKKSTRSKDGQECCVEVGLGDRIVAIRDSKDPDGPILRFTPDDWSVFLRLVGSTRF